MAVFNHLVSVGCSGNGGIRTSGTKNAEPGRNQAEEKCPAGDIGGFQNKYRTRLIIGWASTAKTEVKRLPEKLPVEELLTTFKERNVAQDFTSLAILNILLFQTRKFKPIYI